MIKTIIEALEGFEQQFYELNEMKDNIEAEKEQAKIEALAEVDRKFEAKLNRIEKVLELVSEAKEVEFPDEEIVEESEHLDENEVIAE